MIIRLARVFALAGGLLMLGAAGLVSLDVIFRALFNMAPFRSFELTSYAFAVAMSFSFGLALLQRKYIRIDAVYRLFPPTVRLGFDIVNLALMNAVALSLAYHGTLVAMNSWRIGASSTSSFSVPMIIPQGVWAVGLIWFAFCAVELSVRVLRNLAARRFEQVREDVGIGLDTSEL